MTNTKRTLFVVFCLTALVILCVMPSYAQPIFENEQLYFEYSDGVVRDGARNDRPGIIGDELNRHERDTRSENRDDSPVNNMAKSARGTENAGNGMITFWGIVIAMTVAAAVIILIALVVPKSKGQNNKR